ncbi:unnamed protein product [Oikopleura dioica]|uniref:Succinate dehydrogenase cytochrome b560 subunit, mitochondrial n=1 Tax=Oikopleura dioica TaxID=34765 RepID=E4Y8V9_OIKDI|nr:unnamed protein product [Oikopleura dioica]
MLARLCTRSVNTRFLSSSSQLTSKIQYNVAKPQGDIKSAQTQVDDWLNTNKKLGRPMSPHLTVYAWTIPMTMSALNRIFSFALVGAFMLLPIIDIFSSGSLASDIASFGAEARANGNGAGIFALKMGLLFPLWFHILLGFRHWSWDIFAVGIRNIGTLYQTGYAAIALAIVLTIGMSAYSKAE